MKRWISDYFYNRYKPNNSHAGIDDDIERFLETERATVMGRTYPRYLVEGWEHMDDDARVSAVIAVLDRFALVGCHEHMDQVTSGFERMFEIKPEIPWLNRNPISDSQQEEQLTDEVRQRIEEICRPDIEIYEYVLNVSGRPRLK